MTVRRSSPTFPRNATWAPRSPTTRRNRSEIVSRRDDVARAEERAEEEVSGAATGRTLSTTWGGELRIWGGKPRRDGEEWREFVPRRSLGRRHGRASLRRLPSGRTRA